MDVLCQCTLTDNFCRCSFERYIRICYYCQLRFTSLLTEDNIKFYKLFVLVFPVAFYAPKFFEVVTDVQPGAVVDCARKVNLTCAGLFANVA